MGGCEVDDGDPDDDAEIEDGGQETEPAAPPEFPALEPPMFYILDIRTFVGNCALWWRPEGAGYTTQLEEAGLYTESVAKSKRDTDIAIPEEMAKKCSVTHVRIERLREAMDIAGIPWPKKS